MSHTQEPWNIIRLNEQTDGIVGNYCKEDIGHIQVPPANAARIVACINGCAGLNPAAYQECVERLRSVIKTLTPTYVGFRLNGELSQLVRNCEQALTHAEQTP